MKDDFIRCQHILQSIDAIEGFVADISFEDFKSDLKTYSAVMLHLAIIGEASRSLSTTLKKKHPHIPWREIAGARNLLVHEYFRVDLENVWATCSRDLPKLKEQIEELMAEIGRPECVR